ncbi:hypothetical protein GCM10009557_53110 [Virgisporangium ochraceum]|uniref:Uncharacterized protein n=1 Tax=Virgisporangium ochraceum TaxID=65505 RepID=A0A8J4EC86_9ACTN|nr:hypothetical protein [Virgisporangium ochraceum]GIJ69268.1 hypothetical protein Voc01_041850 [Virgisporangium ochraceum]
MNIGRIVSVARKLLKETRTDTDFRRPPAQGRDVVSGWRETPRVPGSTQDRTF